MGDLGVLEMLEADGQMLQRMRSSLSPDMATMIQVNPMWIDAEMIRLQEQYQAQLDLMLGRQASRP